MVRCVPIKDMRDTASFSKLVDSSPEPITVTKNGYDQFVVMKSEEYSALCEESAKVQLMERMLIAEKERAEGNLINAKESAKVLKDKYDL